MGWESLCIPELEGGASSTRGEVALGGADPPLLVRGLDRPADARGLVRPDGSVLGSPARLLTVEDAAAALRACGEREGALASGFSSRLLSAPAAQGLALATLREPARH